MRALPLLLLLLVGCEALAGLLPSPCQGESCGPPPAEQCGDGLDNDQDGRADCDDLADCIRAPGCAPPGALLRVELPALPPGRELRFEVPEGALGFTILAEGPSDSAIGLERLVSPSGETLIDGPNDPSPRQFQSKEAFGFSFPQGGTLAPGEWKLSFAAESDAPLSAWVLVRAGPFRGGSLTLTLYIPEGLRACGGPGCEGGQGTTVTSENALSLAEITGALATVFDGVITPQTALTRGEVRVRRLPPQYLVLSSQEELDALFRESDSDGGLHVFLIQDLEGTDFPSGVVGVASGIPGAVGVSGVRNAGVAVALTGDPAPSQNLSGLVMAHELGHFLGLWHTTERSGQVDPLSDTPSCPEEQLNDPSAAFQCPDATNIMFPLLSRQAGALSVLQRQMLQGSGGYEAAP